jgi:hypothetical protein
MTVGPSRLQRVRRGKGDHNQLLLSNDSDNVITFWSLLSRQDGFRFVKYIYI